MTYQIEQLKISRKPFGEYQYHIYQEGQLIANYWHDYRGEEHGIEFMSGAKDDWPAGRMIDFIEGGGPKPLTLSAKAVLYLKSHG